MSRFIAAVNKNRALLFVNVIVFFFLINAVSARLSLRLDLTRDQTNSLSASTKKVLAGINDRILIEAYISSDLPGQANVLLEPIRAQLREIERIGDDRIQLRIINPSTEDLRAQAKKRGVQGVQVAQSKVDQSTVQLGYFGIYIQIGDKSKVLSLISQEAQSQGIIEDFEYRFLRELKQLSRKSESSGIGFVNGEGTFALERPQRGRPINKESMYFFKYLLEQESGTLKEIRLDTPVPSELITILVVGLPEFSALERYHLDQYILRGGNVVFLLQGYRFSSPQTNPMLQRFNLGQSGESFATVPKEKVSELNEWLGGYGVTLNAEILVEPDQYTPTFDLEGKYINQFRNPVWALYTRRQNNIPSENPALADLSAVIFPWLSGLDIKSAKQPDAKFEVLVQSSAGAISKNNLSLDVRHLNELKPEPGDARTGRQVPTAVLAQGKFRSIFQADTVPAAISGAERALFRTAQAANSESRIVVMGTAYLVSDVLLQRPENAEIYRFNQVFLTNILEAVSGDTDLLAARSRIRSPEYVENVSPGFKSFFKWFHILFLPLLVGAWGTWRLASRNRRSGLALASPTKEVSPSEPAKPQGGGA